jgi:hypothetical protein
MTKVSPQQSTRTRGTKIVCAKGADVYELLLVELQARRVRLQKLLHLVRMEAERVPAKRAPTRSRAKCESSRFTRTA